MQLGKTVITLIICFGITSLLFAQDWPTWRGPERNDHSNESSGWEQGAWPLEKRIWQYETGEGSSSPVVAAGKLYVLGWQDDQDLLTCLEAISGKKIWEQRYPCPKYGRLSKGDKGIYSGPSSTPEYDKETDFLYTISIDGDLNCWDTQQEGEQVWGINLHEKYTVQQRPKVGRSGHRDYGYTSSPLVIDNWLIVEVGATEGTIIAFDKRTGQEIWRSESQSPAGHNGGPTPLVIDSIPCLAVLNHDGLLVIRIDKGQEGKTVATWPWETNFSNNIASVAVKGNSVLITSAYNHYKMARLDISLNEIKLVWEQEHPSKVCTPIIHQGVIYWAWQKVNCLDFKTGKLIWAGGKTGEPGSIILTSDERLIVWSKRGTLSLLETVKRCPDEYKELSSQELLTGSDAWPHIVLANAHLYAKNRKGELVCYQIAQVKP